MPRPGSRLTSLWRTLPALLVVLAGCSRSSGVPLGQVSGRVTFYGRPVRAEIIFQAESDEHKPIGRPATAISESNGRYAMGYTQQEEGTTVGRQRVIIKVLPFADSGEPPSFKEATTPLKVAHLVRNVHSGKNTFDFALGF